MVEFLKFGICSRSNQPEACISDFRVEMEAVDQVCVLELGDSLGGLRFGLVLFLLRVREETGTEVDVRITVVSVELLNVCVNHENVIEQERLFFYKSPRQWDVRMF